MTVTQADVAARAGVARKTVSNVINNYPHVSDDVRARVLAAIEELDYRPNHAARSLRSGHSRIIGLAVPELDVAYFSELARLVVEVAQKRGLTVMIMQTLGDRDRELAVVNGTSTQFVEGLIYSPVALGGADLEGRRDRTPIVLLGERSSQGLVDHVGIDNVAAARTATEHLIEIGRRRIAFIGSQRAATSEIAQLRTAGYRQALRPPASRSNPASSCPLPDTTAKTACSPPASFAADRPAPGRPLLRHRPPRPGRHPGPPRTRAART